MTGDNLSARGGQALRVYVTGRVQGVGFRMATVEAAQRIGVTGTVRNLIDGRVEAVIEGEQAELDAMDDWLRSGPPSARVGDLEIRSVEATDATAFELR